jgi:hypothetical protein
MGGFLRALMSASSPTPPTKRRLTARRTDNPSLPLLAIGPRLPQGLFGLREIKVDRDSAPVLERAGAQFRPLGREG